MTSRFRATSVLEPRRSQRFDRVSKPWIGHPHRVKNSREGPPLKVACMRALSAGAMRNENVRQRAQTVDSLTTDTFSRVASFLPLDQRRQLQRVCKQWARYMKTSGLLYEELRIDFTGFSEEAAVRPWSEYELGRWAEARLPFTRRLSVLHRPEPTPDEECLFSKMLEHCSGLGRLRQLEITYPGWLAPPQSLCLLTQLQVLALSAQKACDPLPAALGNLRSLEELHIRLQLDSGHRVPTGFLPLQLLSLVSLRVLNMEDCGNVTLPYAAGELPSLSRLAVSGCRALALGRCSFMHTTFAAMRLRTLTLSDCQLYLVPHQVGSMRSLVELDLSHNHLQSLPATFSLALKHLTRLILSDNDFSCLPRLLARLPSLRDLDLSFNQQLQASQDLLPQVHKGEVELEANRQPAGWERGPHHGGVRHAWSPKLVMLACRLTALRRLDLRQAPDKSWHRESLQQLRMLEALIDRPEASRSPQRPCSLQTLLL